MALRAWKIALLFFAVYGAAFIAIALLSVGGHMAHGDTYGTRQVPITSSLVVMDFWLNILGFPLVSIFTALAELVSIRLSALHYIFLFIANGIAWSCLATCACLWVRRKRRGSDPSA